MADGLRIVAVGASAGGLEPLERLFAGLPAEPGCAFVVVQHLSPNFRSMMDELLARRTNMRIRHLEDGMTLERDCIHLNTPRSLATLDGNRIRLETVSRTMATDRPIDALLESLADGHGEHALAIVLSGTGSDGRNGCERIARSGGKVLVQSPPDARFDSMPRAVIEAGLGDATAPAERLAGQVMRWLAGKTLHDVGTGGESEDPLQRILTLLRTRYGTDFLKYKNGTIIRRMRRRTGMCGLSDLEHYVHLLERDAGELDELYGDLLIEVTSFFRDHEAFERVAETVVPDLVAMVARGEVPRIWVPGCASGEEPYSLAILLAERAAEAGTPLEARIIATDIHARSLERAAAARYPLSSVAHLDDERIDRHFERHGEEVRIREDLRRLVMFGTHDVVRDAPFTRIDLLSCRNLLIYLKRDTQQRVIARFHAALKDGGRLLLGPSENIANEEHGFGTLDRKWCLHEKLPGATPRSAPASGGVTGTDRVDTRRPRPIETRGEERPLDRRRAYRLALERVVAEHAPPGFLLTATGDVLHIFGDAGALLPMSRGAFSTRITELVVPELRATLFAALQIARDSAFDGFSRRVPVPIDGDAVIHDIALERVDIGGVGDDSPDFLLLTITPEALPRDTARSAGLPVVTSDEAVPGTTGDSTAGDSTAGDSTAATDGEPDTTLLLQRIRDLEQDLIASEKSLQRTIEELEATNEELQSTNEELSASNEELQGANEELHSVNEELYTISAEHQHRIEELSDLTADMDRLLHSSDIGTILLDGELRLRRASERAESLFGLGARDIGRGVGRTGGGLPAEATALIERTLERRAPLEIDLPLGESRHLLRLVPYFDGDGALDALLITTVDVTELTETRGELVRIDREYRTIVEDTSSFIVRWRADDDAITYCNDIYADFFGTTPDELVGHSLAALIPEDEREGFFEAVHAIAAGESRFLTVVRENADGRATYTVGYTRAVADEDGRTIEYQSTGQDLSDEYAYRRALERLVETTTDPALEHPERLRRILEHCLGYLGLSSAFAGRIDGEHCILAAVAGGDAERHAVGDALPLGETVCSALPGGSDGLLAVEHLARSELAGHPCHAVTGTESFIGTRLVTADGDYGAIAFSSAEPREAPFTVAERGFVMLVASWIGYMIEGRRQLERIGESNDYYQSLYLGVPVALCLTDAEGTITEVSDEWLDHLGCERGSSVGTPFVDILDEEDRERARAAIREGFAEDLSLGVRDTSGSSHEHEMNCRTRTIGTLADRRLIVLTDVSGRRRAIDALESRNDELALANENLNQFAFVASHDLQEPLRKIQQFSGFLVEDDRDALSEDGRYHLEVIVDAAERMSSLIRDLLQYSRAARNTLDREPVALDAVLARVREDLALRLAESGATLQVEPLPEVAGDPTLLSQLFTNLVGNAIKYREPARPLHVRVRVERSGACSRILVEDNGIGFDDVYATKVFEPFTRLHGAKRYPGTGIGLAICATVCRKHGWEIEAGGTPGAGATFAITLGAEDGAPRGDVERNGMEHAS